MESKNTFFKGLNQDNSKSKFNDTSYYDALNIRITTDTGLSSLSVENERGNKLLFSFPNIPGNYGDVLTYKDGSDRLIPGFTGTNLKIVGSCIANEYIIICTTSETSENPVNQYGQIWVIKFDNTLNEIEGNVSNVLPLTALKYIDKLNFSTANKIECKALIETEKIFNFYFTDNYNPFKSINLALTFEELALIKPQNLELNQNADLVVPIITDLVEGSLPSGTVVQLAYRLSNKTLGSSSYSQPCNPITISDFDYKNITLARKQKGNLYKEQGDKGIKYFIEGVDTNYDLIEHIAIVYTAKDSPTIYKFKEEIINGRKRIDNVLSGNEEKLFLNEVEYNQIRFGFETCKTIDSLANILVAGNITTKNREIPDNLFDARAYRFNASQQALLVGKSGNITLIGPTPNYDSVPITHDAINPFNVQKGANETIPNYGNYKYKVNGTTIGGEGKFVSYEFVEETLDGNNNPGDNSHIIVNKTTPTIDLTTKDYKNDNITFVGQSQFKNFKSPIIQHYYTGYTRGEIYRFGIQFFDKKGQPYFVKWVGDIKFPESADGFYYHNVAPGDVENVLLKSLGIRFTVNIPEELLPIISAYKIVRVERQHNDESRLGSAPVVLWGKKLNTTDIGNEDNKTIWYQNQRLEPGDEFIRGPVGNLDYMLNCRPYNKITDAQYDAVSKEPETSMRALMWFSPLLLFGKYYKSGDFINNKSGDFLKTDYFARSYMREIRGMSPANKKFLSLNKYDLRTPLPVLTERGLTEETFAVENLFYKDSNATESGKFLNLDVFSSDYSNFNNYTIYKNANDKNPNKLGSEKFYSCYFSIWKSKLSGGFNKGLSGIGNNTNLILCKNDSDHTTYSPNAYNDWYNSDTLIVLLENPSTTIFGYSFKMMSYCRKISNQYNGNDYESRSNQKYISTGHYQLINDTIFNNNLVSSNCRLSHNIYGGDTFVNIVAHEYIIPSLGNTKSFNYRFMFSEVDENQFKGDDTKRGFSMALVYPTESTINTDLNIGEFQYASDRTGFPSDENPQQFDKMADTDDTVVAIGGESILKNDFVLNENYQQENNVSTKGFTNDFFNLTSEKFTNRLWASEKKLTGELFDSWRVFKDLEYLDVNGEYGEIVKVIEFKDKILFIQERGIGVVNINERSVITSNDGTELVLGTSQSQLNYFKYIATETGTKHQFSVVKSNNSLYYYDSLNNKIIRYGQGEELSTLKGMSSWLINNVSNNTRITDKTLNGTGIHSVYDSRHNRVFFTFLQQNNNKTLSYSEKIDAFESLYSFTPKHYIEIDNILISTENVLSKSYIHDKGNYGVFYDKTPEDSYITLLFNNNPDFVKVFDNILYNTEVKDINGNDIFNETITNIQIYNDYQNTGDIQLVVNDNVKRRLRSWRYAIDRNQNTKERIRDYYVFGKFTFDNTNNRRLILHDVIMFYRPSIL